MQQNSTCAGCRPHWPRKPWADYPGGSSSGGISTGASRCDMRSWQWRRMPGRSARTPTRKRGTPLTVNENRFGSISCDRMKDIPDSGCTSQTAPSPSSGVPYTLMMAFSDSPGEPEIYTNLTVRDGVWTVQGHSIEKVFLTKVTLFILRNFVAPRHLEVSILRDWPHRKRAAASRSNCHRDFSRLSARVPRLESGVGPAEARVRTTIGS